MNASSTTETDNTKKGTRRKVLVFDDEDFTIDESDYRVISELLLASGILGDEVERQAQQIVGIRENDEERRVHTLAMQPDMNFLLSLITSLPPSIGRLQKLKHLNLSCTENSLQLSNTENLLQLPEEIGDLVSLTKLNLHQSGITSLPPSIGRLQNLKVLDLSWTKKLLELPEEIGDLSSLNELDLAGSKIESLPSSIGRLQDLQNLNLSWTKNLLTLPEEIGDLVSLNKLDLGWSGISLLPPSIGRLLDLQNLNLSYTDNFSELPEEIVDLASLSFLNLGTRLREDVRADTKLFLALICNRAKSRMIPTKLNLWPLTLNNATHAYDDCVVYYGEYTRKTYSVPKPDAIYQLLIDGRESFLDILLDRRT